MAWIEDSAGLYVAEMNPLIDPMEAFRAAELLASGTNSYLRIRDAARESGKLGGRPKKLKNSGKRSIKTPSAKRRRNQK